MRTPLLTILLPLATLGTFAAIDSIVMAIPESNPEIQVADISFGSSPGNSDTTPSTTPGTTLSESDLPSEADSPSTGDRPSAANDYDAYRRVIEQTTDMVYDEAAQQLVRQYGLDILNVTWEDTGRYHNSAVGPNISDMTIQVQQQHPDTGDYSLHLMPVIRYPNFTDHTADVPLEEFFVPVGNAQGEALRSVALADVLGNLRQYLTEPDSWAGRETSLLADRDSHVLVSAQACFLPVPQAGIAEFNPVLFNYQSYPGDPAVLTILATREGTSVTVIDNQQDGFDAGHTWGQRLFFNQNGDRASLTGQRVSDFLTNATPSDPRTSRSAPGTSDELTPEERVESEGLNMVLLIQVPLRQSNPMPSGIMEESMMAAPDAAMLDMDRSSNVEEAVIGHGSVEGPFTEIDGLAIERHPDFPIRVTVQFYKATSNGVIFEQDVQAIRQQMARVYSEADYVGSLVVDGLVGRPTEYEGEHEEPANWWEQFWQHYEENMGRSSSNVLHWWRRLSGSSDES